MPLNQEQFQNEVDYSTIMLSVKEMLDAELINKSEFAKIEKLYVEKYNPILRYAARQN